MKALIPITSGCDLFGDRYVSGDHQVKTRSLVRALIQYDWDPYLNKQTKKKIRDRHKRECHAEMKAMRLQAKECQDYCLFKAPKAREEPWNRFSSQPSGAQPADAWIRDVQPSALRDGTVLLCKPPRWSRFVTAALADQHIHFEWRPLSCEL